MERFGEYLKAQREKRNIRLEEIASITKIHLHSLELLEAGQWKQLPPEPFIRGFITAYAKYVGLDLKETIARYLEDVGQKAADLASPVPQATPVANGDSPSDVIQNAWQLPTKQIAAVAAGVVVVALLGTFIYLGRDQSGDHGSQITESRPRPETVSSPASVAAPVTEEARKVASPNEPVKPSEVAASDPAKATGDTKLSLTASPLGDGTGKALLVPPLAAKVETPAVAVETQGVADAKAVDAAQAKVAETNKPVPTTSSTASQSTSPNVAEAAAGAPAGEEFAHDVSIEGKFRTWIKVVIDDKMPVEYFLPKGEKANYKAKSKLKVVLGDSTGAVVTYNGEVNKGKKFKGTIYSYIFPANARFPQDIPKRTTTAEGEEKTDTVEPSLQ